MRSVIEEGPEFGCLQGVYIYIYIYTIKNNSKLGEFGI